MPAPLVGRVGVKKGPPLVNRQQSPVIYTEFDDFETGTNGASHGFTDGIFDFGFNTGITATYTNARSITGTLSCEWNSTGSGTSVHAIDIGSSTTPFTTPILGVRTYIYFETFNAPGAAVQLIDTRDASNGGAAAGANVNQVALLAAGTLSLRNASSAVGSAYTPSAGQWYRIEWLQDLFAGTQYMKIWTGATLHSNLDSDAVINTSGAATSSGKSPAQIRYGIGVATTNALKFQIDAIGYSTGGWVGPWIAGPASYSLTATDSAAALDDTYDVLTANGIIKDFESGTTGWTGAAVGWDTTTIAQSTTQVHSGSNSLKVTASASPPTTIDGVRTTAVVGVTGTRYRWSCWVWATASVPDVELTVYGVGAFSGINTTKSGWQQLTLDYTATSGGNLFFGVRFVTTPANGDLFYIDDASVTVVPTSNITFFNRTAPDTAGATDVATGTVGYYADITRRAAVTGTNAQGVTSLAVTLPPGILGGDYIVLRFSCSSNTTLDLPSGYTRVLDLQSTSASSNIYAKYAAGTFGAASSDASATVTVNYGATTRASAVGNVYYNVDQTNALDLPVSNNSPSSSSTSFTYPSLGTNTDKARVIVSATGQCTFGSTQSWTQPSGFGNTGLAQSSAGSGNNSFTAIADNIKTPAGVTGTFTDTWTVATTAAGSATTLALRPATLFGVRSSRTIAETVGGADTETHSVSGSNSRPISENVGGTDTAPRVMRFARTASDTAAAADAETHVYTPAGTTNQEVEDFDTGTNGNTIGTSDGILDGGFTTGASISATYSNAQSISGSLSAKFVTTDGTGTAARNITFNNGTDIGSCYFRSYVYVSAGSLSTSSYPIHTIANNAGTNQAQIVISSVDQFKMRDGTTAVGSGYTFTRGQWYRLEWHVDAGAATQYLRIWTGANLHSASTGTTVLNTSGTFTGTRTASTYKFGITSATGVAATIYFDGVGYNLIDWVGPFGTGLPRTATDTAAATDTAPRLFHALRPVPDTAHATDTATGGASHGSQEVEDFDAGSNGSTVNTTDGILDGGSNGANTTITYSNAQKVTGTLSAKFSTTDGVNSAIRYITFNSGTDVGTAYFRTYVYFDTGSAPTASVPILQLKSSGGTVRAQIAMINGTNKLKMRNNTTAVGNGYTITRGQWYRVEWHHDTGASTQYLRIWTGSTIHSPDYADCVLNESGTLTNTFTSSQYQFGIISGWSTAQDVYFDGVGYNLNGWVGPAPSFSPVASFTTDGATFSAPHDVTFTDTSTNSPTSWTWDFGDGSTSSLQNPVHAYHTAGTYNVTLTAVNSGGSNTSGSTAMTVSAGTNALLMNYGLEDNADGDIPVGTDWNSSVTAVGSSTGITVSTIQAVVGYKSLSVDGNGGAEYFMYPQTTKFNYFRAYLYLDNHAAAGTVFGIRNGAGVWVAQIQVTTGQHIKITNGTSSAWTSTNTYLREWVRLEWFTEAKSYGVQRLRIYSDSDLNGTTITEDSGNVDCNVQSATDGIAWGAINTADYGVYIDSVAIDSGYWVGPDNIPPVAGFTYDISGTSAPITLKTPPLGVVTRDMDGYSHRTTQTLAGTYSSINWMDLQPNGQGTAIDQSGAAWADIVSAFATGLTVAIRIQGGVYAPLWAKRLSDSGDQPPMTIDMNTSGNLGNLYTYTCGRWWTEAFKQAWDDFMTVLANTTYGGYTLDNHPQLSHVAAHPAQTVFTEPMLRQMSVTQVSPLGSNDVWSSSYTYNTGDVIRYVVTGGSAWSSGTTYALGDIVTAAVPAGGPNYSSGTTYARGDYVTQSGVAYISIQDGNTNHAPASNPAWWSTTASFFSQGSGNIGNNPVTDGFVNWTFWGGWRSIQDSNTNHTPQTATTWWSKANPNVGLKNSEAYHNGGLPGSSTQNTMDDPLEIAAIRHPFKIDDNGLPHWYNIGWHHTRLLLSCSPVQTFKSSSPATTGNDLSWTQQTIKLLSDTMGPYAITANNSWTMPDSDVQDNAMWVDQQVTNNAWGEQTETLTKLRTDYHADVDAGASDTTIVYNVAASLFGLMNHTTDPTIISTHNTSAYSVSPGTTIGQYRGLFCELPAGWQILSNAQCIALNAAAAANPYSNIFSSGTGTGSTVQFTNTSTGSGMTFLWDFGDGTTSTDTNPVHIYTASGLYSVTLTAYTSGGSDTYTTNIQIGPATATYWSSEFDLGTPGAALVPSDVGLGGFGTGATNLITYDSSQYIDAGNSLKVVASAITTPYFVTTNPSIYMRMYIKLTSLPSTGWLVLQEMQQAGSYISRLQIDSTGKLQVKNVTSSVTASNALPANTWMRIEWGVVSGTSQEARVYIGTNMHGTTPDYVITNTVTGTNIDKWVFGSLSSSSTNSVYYMDAAALGSDWLGPLSIGASAPGAAFTTNSIVAYAPASITFTDVSSNNPTSWSWDFGAGQGTGTGAIVSHNYTTYGNYIVTLTATNSHGSSQTSTNLAILDPNAVSPVVNSRKNNVWVSNPQPKMYSNGQPINGKIRVWKNGKWSGPAAIGGSGIISGSIASSFNILTASTISGSYVSKFSILFTSTGSRFAGDPGVGKIWLGVTGAGLSPAHLTTEISNIRGMSYAANGFPAAGADATRNINIVRIYDNVNDSVSSMFSTYDSYSTLGQIVWLSWAMNGATAAAVMAGTYDSWFNSVATAFNATSRNKYAYWITLQHEPENPSKGYVYQSTGPTNAGAFAARANYRAAYRKVAKIFRDAGVNNIAWAPTLGMNHTINEATTDVYNAASPTSSDLWFEYNPDWRGTITTAGGTYWANNLNPNPADFTLGTNPASWSNFRITDIAATDSYCIHAGNGLPGYSPDTDPHLWTWTSYGTPTSNFSKYSYEAHDVIDNDYGHLTTHSGRWSALMDQVYGANFPRAFGELGYPLFEGNGTGNPQWNPTSSHYMHIYQSFLDHNVVGFAWWQGVPIVGSQPPWSHGNRHHVGATSNPTDALDTHRKLFALWSDQGTTARTPLW